MRVGKVAERWLPEGSVSLDVSSQLIQAGFELFGSAGAVHRNPFGLGAHHSWCDVRVGSARLELHGAAERRDRHRARTHRPAGDAGANWRLRQERIIHSIPDTLDLLLVCVEAGVSLDAALLRVGREMVLLHPELANELLTMNRRMNAGMRREEALHGLYERTGVDELRALGDYMIQSERWGTSIAKVLRVYSESMRRKRRQAAEKKAAVAATKMVFPLALFILPALFAIIGGPAVLAIGPVFKAMGQ